MEILALWLIFAVLVAVIANSNGRSGFLWFLLSIIISPLLGLLFVLIAGKAGKTGSAAANSEGRVRCDQCHELIMPQAKLCKHCGGKREPALATAGPYRNPARSARSESFGYSIAKKVREPMFWAVMVILATVIYVSNNPDAFLQFRALFA